MIVKTEPVLDKFLPGQNDFLSMNPSNKRKIKNYKKITKKITKVFNFFDTGQANFVQIHFLEKEKCRIQIQKNFRSILISVENVEHPT